MVDHLRCNLTVNRKSNCAAESLNVVLVPAVLVNIGHEGGRVPNRCAGLLTVHVDDSLLSTCCKHSAASLVVECPGPLTTLIDVRLVASYMTILVNTAADLDAGVCSRSTHDSILELQFKVVQFAQLPNEELIRLDRMLLGRFTGNRPVLDRPVAHVRRLPAIEVFAVKDGLKAILLGGNGGACNKGRQREQHNTNEQ